jgi:hypothetical protein
MHTARLRCMSASGICHCGPASNSLNVETSPYCKHPEETLCYVHTRCTARAMGAVPWTRNFNSHTRPIEIESGSAQNGRERFVQERSCAHWCRHSQLHSGNVRCGDQRLPWPVVFASAWLTYVHHRSQNARENGYGPLWLATERCGLWVYEVVLTARP